jgi:D-lactate dehydrogenase (cytochrome)
VPEFHKALEALYEQHKSKMDTLGIWYGGMFGSAGSSSFLYEVALYWPDEISAYHREVIPHDYLEQLPKYQKNTEAREFVHQLKTEITELLIQFEAIHFQIGKAYPYIDRLLPETKKLINDIKESLDPNNLSSPGSLGFE